MSSNNAHVKLGHSQARKSTYIEACQARKDIHGRKLMYANQLLLPHVLP